MVTEWLVSEARLLPQVAHGVRQKASACLLQIAYVMQSKTTFTIGACLLLAVAAFFLWTEHRAHLLGALPYLLLLLCPVVHFFMHGRHGSSHGGHEDHARGGGPR
jgi:hypothetical protein